MNPYTNFRRKNNLTPILDSMIIKCFILKICDKDIALSRVPTINDIIVNGDIQSLQFRKYIKPVLETEIKIPCNRYEFQDHDVIMCLNLDQLKVCILESDGGAKIFNQRNYALVIFLDYFN